MYFVEFPHELKEGAKADRIGTRKYAYRKYAYRNCLSDYYLLNVGFNRDPFIWKHGILQQRLDRVLLNLDWRLLFSKFEVDYLSYYKFDHGAN
ncbi:hypothetical protein CR513_23313, partial [Mucuna pruriens]